MISIFYKAESDGLHNCGDVKLLGKLVVSGDASELCVPTTRRVSEPKVIVGSVGICVL